MPRRLLVSLTSDSASVAVPNRRPGDTTWLKNVGGGENAFASSGRSPRSLPRARTRLMPAAVSLANRGSLPSCFMWSRNAPATSSPVNGDALVA